ACGETPGTIAITAPRSDTESSEPLTYVEVRDRALATSGSSQRGWTIAGRRYSHIIDPRSGMPAAGVATASVIAPGSAGADALATIFNVLEPRDSLRLASALPGVEAPIVTSDGRLVRTPGWSAYEKAATNVFASSSQDGLRTHPKAAASDDAGAWGNENEL